MASRKQTDSPRNDAEAVFDRLFGDTDGWDERVAAATDAVLLAEEVYALRERHGLSQRALAELINSSQSAVARMEDATYRGHSISVLRRIAAAVGEKVSVRFVPPSPSLPSSRKVAGKGPPVTKKSARSSRPNRGRPQLKTHAPSTVENDPPVIA